MTYHSGKYADLIKLTKKIIIIINYSKINITYFIFTQYIIPNGKLINYT